MRYFKKFTRVLFSAIVLSTVFVNMAFAAENLNESNIPVLEAEVQALETDTNSMVRSTTFADATIDIQYSASGMSISITTSMTKTASVVGVKDIEIQIKSGSSWVTVATSTGGELYDVLGCVVDLTYTGSVQGETYRVVCTHYGNVDGYRELYHETAGFKCVY